MGRRDIEVNRKQEKEEGKPWKQTRQLKIDRTRAVHNELKKELGGLRPLSSNPSCRTLQSIFGPFERVDLLGSHVLCTLLSIPTFEASTQCKADAPKPWRRILTGIKASMCCRMLLPQFHFFSFCVLTPGAKLKNTKWISQPISCPSPRVRPSLIMFPTNENTQTVE